MSLGDLQSDIRHHGLVRAIVRAGYYRAHAAFGLRVYRFMVLEPEHVNRELIARRIPYECRMLEDGDLRSLALDPESGIKAATVAAAVHKRHLCYAIHCGAELVSYGWYSAHPCPVDSGAFLVRFDPRYVYMFNGYTKPAHRGHNLHGIGLARAMEAVCARGYRGVVTLAERVNFSSLRSAHRVGYRDCGLAAAARVGGVTRGWHSRGPERYALQLCAHSGAAPAGVPLDETIA